MMKELNRVNYGAWIVDYEEGNLSPVQVAELFLFLEENPDLKAEFESFSGGRLPEEAIVMPGKASLHRGVINSENIDWHLAAELEGDLDAATIHLIDAFVKTNPEYSRARNLYSKTILHPEEIIFNNSHSLKKGKVLHMQAYFKVAAAVAAVILIAFLIYITNEPAPQLAEPVQQENNQSKDLQPDPDKNQLTEELPDKMKERTTEGVINKSKKLSGENAVQKSIVQISDERIEYVQPRQLLPASDLQHVLPDVREAAVATNNASMHDVQQTNALPSLPEDDQSVASSEALPLKSRLLKFLSAGVARISDDKIQFNPAFDHSGDVAAYEVTAGRIKYEREF